MSLFSIKLGWSVATRSMQCFVRDVIFVGLLTVWVRLWYAKSSCILSPNLSIRTPLGSVGLSPAQAEPSPPVQVPTPQPVPVPRPRRSRRPPNRFGEWVNSQTVQDVVFYV